MVIYLDKVFDEYQNGKKADKIAADLYREIRNAERSPSFSFSGFGRYLWRKRFLLHIRARIYRKITEKADQGIRLFF